MDSGVLAYCRVLSSESSGPRRVAITTLHELLGLSYRYITTLFTFIFSYINPYPTAFPYGNGMVLHFYQEQESSTTKTVHKVINKGLKTYV